MSYREIMQRSQSINTLISTVNTHIQVAPHETEHGAVPELAVAHKQINCCGDGDDGGGGGVGGGEHVRLSMRGAKGAVSLHVPP